MITSEIIKIKYTNDIEVVEQEIKNLGIDPLRWAIVAVVENELIISVSFEC